MDDDEETDPRKRGREGAQVPVWVRELIGSEQFKQPVRSVFDYYCSYAESELKSDMAAGALYKFIKDAGIEGKLVNQTNIDLIVIQGTRAVGTEGKKRKGKVPIAASVGLSSHA